ncbi:hypothetical protein HZA86_03775 [Candidatus Uhrbacteria bacterium]|nr:hypothetical protein [Candidatus Uhrbacteria bacterium]
MTPEKKERNYELCRLRNANPKIYSWGRLGKHFGIDRSTAQKIYTREMKRRATKKH